MTMLLVVTLALLQDPPPDSLLAGPKVEASSTPVAGEGFAPGRNRRNGGQVPLRTWFELYDALGLTGEQRTEGGAIVAAYRAKAKAYEREHGEEIRRLREKARRAREARRDIPRELAARLQRLRADAPRADAAQRELWALLDEVQKNAFQASLEAAREEIAQRRARRRAAEGGATDRMDVMTDPATDRAPMRDVGDLDEMARRRLAFLQSRQRK